MQHCRQVPRRPFPALSGELRDGATHLVGNLYFVTIVAELDSAVAPASVAVITNGTEFPAATPAGT
jgi:hypothetical protein